MTFTGSRGPLAGVYTRSVSPVMVMADDCVLTFAESTLSTYSEASRPSTETCVISYSESVVLAQGHLHVI